MRKGILAVVVSLIVLAFGLASSAHAAPTTAAVVSDGQRLTVTFKGKKPTKAKLVAAGASYQLKKNGKVWRTKPLSQQQLAALVGEQATVKVRVGGKKRSLRATVRSSTTPVPPAPSAPPAPPAPVPLFAAPGTDSTGLPAFNAIRGYFENSTLTDCPAGWPNCPVEQRYGFFADQTMWYCRLTNTVGADIRSVGSIQEIVGAEQKADGSWAVSFRDLASGYEHYYTVRVSANGAGTIEYWESGVDPRFNPPSEVKTGLVWMRGAKDCSY